MALSLRRRFLGRSVRSLAPLSCIEDSELGRLVYLGGWWYGNVPLLGFRAVRLRISGTLERPAFRALRAVRQLQGDAERLCTEIDGLLWRTALGCLDLNAERVTRTLQAREALKPCYALVALCAGAEDDERILELAFESTDSAARLVLPYHCGRLGAPRPCASVWRTPALRAQRPA